LVLFPLFFFVVNVYPFEKKINPILKQTKKSANNLFIPQQRKVKKKKKQIKKAYLLSIYIWLF